MGEQEVEEEVEEEEEEEEEEEKDDGEDDDEALSRLSRSSYALLKPFRDFSNLIFFKKHFCKTCSPIF